MIEVIKMDKIVLAPDEKTRQQIFTTIERYGPKNEEQLEKRKIRGSDFLGWMGITLFLTIPLLVFWVWLYDSLIKFFEGIDQGGESYPMMISIFVCGYLCRELAVRLIFRPPDLVSQYQRKQYRAIFLAGFVAGFSVVAFLALTSFSELVARGSHFREAEIVMTVTGLLGGQILGLLIVLITNKNTLKWTLAWIKEWQKSKGQQGRREKI